MAAVVAVAAAGQVAAVGFVFEQCAVRAEVGRAAVAVGAVAVESADRDAAHVAGWGAEHGACAAAGAACAAVAGSRVAATRAGEVESRSDAAGGVEPGRCMRDHSRAGRCDDSCRAGPEGVRSAVVDCTRRD